MESLEGLTLELELEIALVTNNTKAIGFPLCFCIDPPRVQYQIVSFQKITI